MVRPAAPLAAAGAVLALLALAALARPHPAPGGQVRDAPPEVARVEPRSSAQRQRLLSEEPIDVNAASVADFELLPRIGPTLAARIVEERERGGRFGTVDELARVRGIGPRTLERLRPLVVVAP